MCIRDSVDAKTLSNDDLADSNGKITADFPVFVRSKVLAKNVDDNKLGWAFKMCIRDSIERGLCSASQSGYTARKP